MIMPYIPVASSDSDSIAETSLLVLEVELGVFQAALSGTAKPIVFQQHAGFPKQHRYFFRNGPYFLLYRQREALDLSGQATIIPVKSFFTSPAAVI